LNVKWVEAYHGDTEDTEGARSDSKSEISNLRFEIEILGVLRVSVVNFNPLDAQQ
jgi:hypothetical protein